MEDLEKILKMKHALVYYAHVSISDLNAMPTWQMEFMYEQIMKSVGGKKD